MVIQNIFIQALIIWLAASGCSNHMSGVRKLSKDLDESQDIKVRLGNDNEVLIEERDTVAFDTHEDIVKLLHRVQYMPSLA